MHSMAQDKKKELLYLAVAQRVKAHIDSSSDAFLPSLHQLCKQHGVSLYTMSKAVEELARQGLLEVSQGKRMRVIGKEGARGEVAHAGSSSSIALYRKIKDAIVEGSYRAGQSLPKVKYFVLTEHYSNDTVCEALRILEKENLIHKEGRRWAVGPRRADIRARGGLSADSPVVIVFSSNVGHHNILFDQHLEPLTSALYTELSAGGVGTKVAFEYWDKQVAAPFPTDRNSLLSLVNALGNRYQGTFANIHATSMTDLPELLDWLCQFKKPVVWLDMDNKGPQFTRSRIARRNYYRLYSDEREAISLSVDRLHELGHREIGIAKYKRYTGHVYFVEERIEHVRNKIISDHLPMTVTVADLWSEPWDEWSDVTDETVFDELAKARTVLQKKNPALKGARFEKELGKLLMKQSRSLTQLLKREKLTAIMAMNEWLGLNYYYWLTHAGVSVPKELSIIGYDNYRRFAHHPVSTIDLKLDDLGYLAAHIFIGDIPVRSDRQGNVPARPVLVDRGSLGPARKGMLVLP
jgi:DNA-binding LacI/PurR family transcriptional regulator/DNA-binding GntR family transcriptional regulator